MAGTQVGSIMKQYTGIVDVMLGRDTFAINFEVAIPVVHKAVLMGAVFLIVSCLQSWWVNESRRYCNS